MEDRGQGPSAELDPRRRAPILLVRDLAVASSFWVDCLGFVESGGGPGLRWLQLGCRPLTLWTREAAAAELGGLADSMGDSGCLFLPVPGLASWRTRLIEAGLHLEELLPPRVSRGELRLCDPDGHRVVLVSSDSSPLARLGAPPSPPETIPR